MPKSSDELLRLLHSGEHTFVERKTVNDGRDWLKSVIAFANTLEPNQEGVLFIGATDQGEIEAKTMNVDSIQKSFSKKMEDAYPPVYYTTCPVSETNKECLAVIVPGSPNKPHFGGKLYLRQGSETKSATAEQYEALLAQRTEKAREIQQWVGRGVTLKLLRRRWGIGEGYDQNVFAAEVKACNRFYVTLFYNNINVSYSLSKLELSFDHVQSRLELEVVLFHST